MWLLFALQVPAGLPHGSERDLAILARIAAGEALALAELYDGYARPLFSLAFRIVRDQAEAEEVVQDVFTQAWRQAGGYDRQRGPVVAWLLMITRSRAIDRLRAGRAHGRPHADLEADVGELPAELVAADAALVLEELTARARHALELLPAAWRLPIELAFYEGLTHAAIAERLEQPLGTVKTRIRAGMMSLRGHLEPRWMEQ